MRYAEGLRGPAGAGMWLWDAEGGSRSPAPCGDGVCAVLDAQCACAMCVCLSGGAPWAWLRIFPPL